MQDHSDKTHHSETEEAPKLCTTEAWDADEHAHNLTDWRQEYDQISDGAFYGRIDEHPLEQIQVFREHTSQALRQQCRVWPDSIWVGIPSLHQSSTEESRINGLTVAPGQIMCRPGNLEFELVTPSDFDIYGVVVNEQLLHRAASQCSFDSEQLTRSQPNMQVNRRNLEQLCKLVDTLLYSGAGSMAVQVAPQFKTEVLITALINVLQQNPEEAFRPPPVSYQHRKAVVDRVKEYVISGGYSPTTVTELCELTHVSRRTLQYSFESILGISPLKFLRITRLNQVRRALSQPDCDRPVASVAADWGFWHPGQFARDYKQLFGENPSETVRRFQPQRR